MMMTKLCFLPALLAALLLGACSSPDTAGTATEEVPADYGRVLELAREEFDAVFADFSGLEVLETSTMVRENAEKSIVVQFTYASENGDGVYGFEMQKDGPGEYRVLQQGTNVTIDSLVN